MQCPVYSTLPYLPTVGWGRLCINAIATATNCTFEKVENLVDESGQHMAILNNDTIGITINACNQYCSPNIVPADFSFQTFSGAMTNYLLPWLALCAQLPYETGDNFSNVMSFFLAVGSPALATYSLWITILNRYWVRGKFHKLWERSRSLNVQRHYPAFSNRILAVQYLLQEAQQVPIRASQERGWLSSLIVSPENHLWWERLKSRLISTRRGFSPSLIAQILLALTAYVFTVIASFLADFGDPSTALQISSGSLWIWLIPVILGWVTVGTQTRFNSIHEALHVDEAHRVTEPPPEDDDPTIDEVRPMQRGILVRSGMNPQPVASLVAGKPFEVPPPHRLAVPMWAGADVQGDERKAGPIYNYARALTWYQVAHSVERALSCTLRSIDAGNACPKSSIPGRSNMMWDRNGRPENNLIGDSIETAQFCGLDKDTTFAYTEWKMVPGKFWKNIFTACLMAIFIQWGTTGPSIMIAYLTPTVGLGCRSASYIVYGCLGTLVWVCLLASSFLSHAIMLRYQKQQKLNPKTDFRANLPENNASTYSRDWVHTRLCAAAVVLRYIGKGAAVINTFWLIITSLMEFTGGFDNCWCEGVALGRTDRVLLFKNAQFLAQAARLPWVMGVVASLLVCLISYILIGLGSSNARE